MLLFCVWWACSGPEPSDETKTTPPVSTTGDTADPPPFEADCTVAPDNVLRLWCTAALAGPGALRVELTPVDAPEEVLTFPSSEVAVEHSVFVWGLRAQTAYQWRIVDETTGLEVLGELTTEELPGDLVELSYTIERDTGSQLDLVLLAPGCPGKSLVMVDRLGRIVWYHRMEDLDPTLGGAINIASWTEDDTVLAVIGKGTLFEFDLQGNILMRADRGVQFENYLHHEIFKRGGYIYSLQSTSAVVEGVDIVADGVYVFDESGDLVDELSVAGLWPIVMQPIMLGGYWSGLFQNALDFSHANSVWVEEGGDIWVSFRHLHAFGKFRGGPGQEGFGELLWIAVGQEDSPIAGTSDFELVGDDPMFEGQHDVHLAEDGTVLLLDNGLTPGDFARGVRYLIDETEGKLTQLESWNLGMWCPIQGAVRELSGGHVLITCASLGRMREYDATGTSVWELSSLCRNTIPSVFSRGMPLYRQGIQERRKRH